jgi:ketosteroid isomerase-like protein
VARAHVALAINRRFWLTVATAGLFALLAGCQVVPTSGSRSTPNQCTPEGDRQVVERFIDAFNRGDIAQLDRLVSQDQFAWYATDAPGQRLNAAAYDRENLMAYFAARHRQHEHLVLNSLDVTFTNAGRGGLWAYVTRSADDGLPPTRYSAKVEVECSTIPSSLTVWAMGRSPWSPIELLPEAAALILIAAGIGGIVLWRRRLASAAGANANITQ